MAGLSWLDFRTTFYTLAAKQLGFDLVLHPIRNTYEVSVLKQYSADRQSSRMLMDSISGVSNDAFNKIVSASYPVLLNTKLPMFSVWVISKMKSMDNFIDTVYTLKGEKEFVRVREILNELDGLIVGQDSQKYIKQANLLVNDFKKQMDKLMDEYNVTQNRWDVTSSFIKAYNLSSVVTQMPSLPVVNVKIKKPELAKRLSHYSGFGAMYKAIINDLTSIEKLGKYHDMLCSRIVLDKYAGTYNMKEEDARFANYKSFWKVPL